VTLSAPHWRSPRPSPEGAIERIRCQTKFGMRRHGTIVNLGSPDRLDRYDQRLEPNQRRDQTGGGRVGKVGRGATGEQSLGPALRSNVRLTI
jgi:hypothetical protein